MLQHVVMAVPDREGRRKRLKYRQKLPQLKNGPRDVSTTFNGSTCRTSYSEPQFHQPPIAGARFAKRFHGVMPLPKTLRAACRSLPKGQHFSGTAFELDGTDNQAQSSGSSLSTRIWMRYRSKVALQNFDAEFGKAVASVVHRAD